ncbi:MAG: class I SAM-dependent methyltransferase [Candidatus Marinamargulisbacteria bacterium]
MDKTNICDYSDYDYKASFWTNQNRDYEHQLEQHVVHKMLKKYSLSYDSVLDAGCGFGRLYPAYCSLFKRCHLVDYAKHLLDEAKESILHSEATYFYEQSVYELAINEPVNAILSIRTLHHLNNVELLFRQYYNTLAPQGILVLDIPNYYHLKHRITHPFEPKKNTIERSKTFYNYHPPYIIDMLKKAKFNVIDQQQVGIFRIPIIKRMVSAKKLVKADLFLNKIIKNINIAPSVYVVAKKCG